MEGRYSETFGATQKSKGYIMSLIKQECFDRAFKIVSNFVIANNVIMPEIVFTEKSEPKSVYCGLYYPSKKLIIIDMKKCRPPTKTPGYAWSYPGYKADKTPYGVLLHEFGHHIYHTHKLSAVLCVLSKKEKVSSYEPTFDERAAETFKLFLGNPDLLRVLCPQRYKTLVDLGFTPVIHKTWQQVLEGAHPKYKQTIEKFISTRSV